MLIKKKAKEGYEGGYYHYTTRSGGWLEILVTSGKQGTVTKSNKSIWRIGKFSSWKLSKFKKGRLKEQNN